MKRPIAIEPEKANKTQLKLKKGGKTGGEGKTTGIH